MSRQRLDEYLVVSGQAPSRSQAASIIKLGDVKINGRLVIKPGHFVLPGDQVRVKPRQHYVSRAGLKLASVAEALSLNFSNKVVLDVGSSTGGFTDFALQHGARKVLAVDVGTDQLHSKLRGDSRVELYEKTDIRDFEVGSEKPDIIVIDVSFISLRDILPHVATLSGPKTQIIAMLKPQFEAGRQQVNKGIIKNDAVRRQILRDFEAWIKRYFVIKDKADSGVAGMKGNQERFYRLQKLA